MHSCSHASIWVQGELQNFETPRATRQVSWLERTLNDFQGTVVGITHDRYFLDNVAGER